MVSSLVNEWFSIELDKPHIVLAGQHGPFPSSTSPVSTSSPASLIPVSSSASFVPTSPSTSYSNLTGSIAIKLTKTMNVRSLNIQFTGLVRSAYFFDSPSLIERVVPCDKFSYSCNLIDRRIPILVASPKEPRILTAGQHTFPFSITLPAELPGVLTTDSVNINYQITASLQPVSILPFSQAYQTNKPVILLRMNDIPDDSFYSPRTVQFASKRTDRVQGEVRVPYRVFPNSGTVPLILRLNLRGNATSVSKVAIELWERAFRLQDQDGSKIQLDERLVSCQSCPISGWPSCTQSGETIEVLKRLLFKVPQMPLTVWGDETEQVVATDRRSPLPKGSCNISGVSSLLGVEIQHSLRVVVFVDGQLASESSMGASFPVDDTARGELQVHILGLQEQQPQESEDDVEPPSYHRSFTTLVVEGERLAEMDRRSFEALQDFSMIMTRPSSLDATTETTTVEVPVMETTEAGNEAVAITVHPPCYEESVRSSFTSSRSFVSSEWIRGASLDQRSLRDSLWDSNSGRPSTSTDTYAQDLANYTERYSFATPLSDA